MDCRIAIAQIDSAVGHLEQNIAHHVKYVKKAIAQKADIIVFPELSITGYSVKDLNWDLALRAEPQPLLSELLTLSKRITIIVGAVEEAANYAIHNSAFVFEDGKVTAAHRKRYLPTYGMFEEQRYFSPGQEVRAFRSKHGTFGILICEDLWHLSLPYILAHDGAEAIISLTASPTRLSGTDAGLTTAAINHEQHRAYARLLSTYLIFANRVGVEDGVNFWGGSQIVGPNGETVATAKHFDEDLVVARLDSNEVRRARRFSRHFIDDDREFTLQQLKNTLNRTK